MDVTEPYDFIGFGTMDVTKPYEFIGFGAPASPPLVAGGRRPGGSQAQTDDSGSPRVGLAGDSLYLPFNLSFFMASQRLPSKGCLSSWGTEVAL